MVIGVALSFIIFLSIAGNTLVCVAVFTDRQLRRTNNYFIVSLAVADLLVSILVMTFAVANDIFGYWVFHPGFCPVWISFDIMGSTASILNLCAISLDRYMHIRNPLSYETWMTLRRAVVMISLVWACSALISFLPIHLGWHMLTSSSSSTTSPPPSLLDSIYVNNVTTTSSTPLTTTQPPITSTTPSVNMTTIGDFVNEEAKCVMELNPLYAVVSSLVSFYVPCIVMLTLYCKLYGYARKHVRSIKKQWSVERFNNVSPNHKGGQYRVSDHKAAMTLGIIMGVFLFCWMPFFTINIISAFCPPCIPDVVFTLFTWLGYVNSALNPIIYSIFNTEFRMAFKRVLRIDRCYNSLRRRRTDYDVGKQPITGNASEYGTVSRKNSLSNVSRKNSRAHLVEKITSL